MTEPKPPGVSNDTWIDWQITRAQEQGAFENLAGAGKPLPRRRSGEQTSYEWALAWARRENGGDVTGMLPGGLALRKQREELPRVLSALRDEQSVRAVVAAFNARVDEYYRRPADATWNSVGMADPEWWLPSGMRRVLSRSHLFRTRKNPRERLAVAGGVLAATAGETGGSPRMNA